MLRISRPVRNPAFSERVGLSEGLALFLYLVLQLISHPFQRLLPLIRFGANLDWIREKVSAYDGFGRYMSFRHAMRF
jgi:hypothetical protein